MLSRAIVFLELSVVFPCIYSIIVHTVRGENGHVDFHSNIKAG